MAGITRKQFGNGLLGGAVLVWLTGCGGGDISDELNQLDGNVRIGSNHRHFLIIPEADLDSGQAQTYDIQGQADHNHTVTFTATQLQNIKNKVTIAAGSSPALDLASGQVIDGHFHSITANPVIG